VNSIIKEIYRTYFSQEELASVAISEEVRLASALQNRIRQSENFLEDYCPVSYVPSQVCVPDVIILGNLKSAFAFITKYSTSGLL